MPSRPLKSYVEALGELCREVRGDLSTPVTGACADSRLVQPGFLFCAIPGARQDGARFVPDAVSRAAAGVISVTEVSVPESVASIVVSDAYHAAAVVASLAAGHPAEGLHLLGVTGTNGKTTCAYLLRDMLRAASRKAGMIGTVCYDLGGTSVDADRTTPTPFELQGLFRTMAGQGCDWAVLEMSSHALVQRRTGSATFRGALFTNLSGDHLDYHHTMEAYYRAKTILFHEMLAADGIAVINIDDPYGQRLAGELGEHTAATCITYGADRDADVSWRCLETTLAGASFELVIEDSALRVDTPLIGRHNVANIAGSAALARACGVPADTLVEAVRTCSGAPGRLQAVTSSLGFAAYVDYAHTDDALRNVLNALRQLRPRRLVVVFGCGGDRDTGKRPRMGRVAAQLADALIVTSDNPRSEDPERIIQDILAGVPESATAIVEVERRLAIRRAVREAQPGDIILVAGKGHETYQETDGERRPFDDVQVVRNAIRGREQTPE